MPKVHVENLYKGFFNASKRVDVLQNISFSVDEGEIVSIIGPSGCGKTTILKILLGEIDADSGRVNISLKEDGSMAYVQQNPKLFPWRTVIQNTTIGLEVKRKKIKKDSILHINDLLNKYQLYGVENYYPCQISGGMCQRVALVRALTPCPELLLCDEPFSSIDYVTKIDLYSEFYFQCRQMGASVLIVTHNIEEAIFLSDKIIILNGSPATIVDTIAPKITKLQKDYLYVLSQKSFGAIFDKIHKLLS